MTENTEKLQGEELAEVEGELLPDREAMSVISTGLQDPMPFPIAPDIYDEPHAGDNA